VLWVDFQRFALPDKNAAHSQPVPAKK
jgi:hypothetical protein